MTKNTRRAQVWHALYSQAKTDKEGVKDIVMYPKPHEAPYPQQCNVEARCYRGRAFGLIEFEPGEQGKLKRCLSTTDEQEFQDVIVFVSHLKALACDHDLTLDGMDLMEQEPELWSNLD